MFNKFIAIVNSQFLADISMNKFLSDLANFLYRGSHFRTIAIIVSGVFIFLSVISLSVYFLRRLVLRFLGKDVENDYNHHYDGLNNEFSAAADVMVYKNYSLLSKKIKIVLMMVALFVLISILIVLVIYIEDVVYIVPQWQFSAVGREIWNPLAVIVIALAVVIIASSISMFLIYFISAFVYSFRKELGCKQKSIRLRIRKDGRHRNVK